MLSLEEKIKLVIEAAKAATEMESRGKIMVDNQPRIQIVLCEYKDMYLSVFPDGKIGEAGNWTGMGSSIEEAVDGNLCCLRYEIEDRMRMLTEMAEKLKVAYPFKQDKEVIV